MLRIVLTSFTLSLFSFMNPGASSSAGNATATEVEVNVGETLNSSTLTFAEKQLAFDQYVQDIYEKARLKQSGLSYDVFRKAVVGYHNFKQQDKLNAEKPVVTVVDFTKSSREKRLWIVDLKSRKVLYNTLVAHGKNTGNDKAVNFSNVPNSNMSSMGFYVTNVPYYGKHGLSLKLSGMDEKYNSNAMSRAIVLHGADYVSESFVKQHGRLGRSLGCPAVPREVSKQIVELIKDNTTLYIHSADKNYTSPYLDQKLAVEAFALEAPMLADNS